ncbi:MFS transporter [Oceanicella sp. SM1341]|uniref:MFS transporter n=1 Tax=Oceanicella sp. SM1341 TaxID=1548889 RepID=UPI0018E59157|nr:MFS transporter [Oceanicella sp. SM1341]
MAHTLWTSAAPSMSYPLYARHWGLSPLETTLIFAVYPAVVAAVMFLSGDLADRLGRRRAMLLGLLASLAGTVLFALAGGLGVLLAGRVLMGLGVGLSAGPSAAMVAETGAEAGLSRPRAAAVTVAAQSLGLVLALGLGGVLIGWAPLPLRLNYILLALVIALLAGLTLLLPPDTLPDGPHRRPRRRHLAPGDAPRLGAATLALVTAYGHGVLITALGAQFATDLVGSASPAVNGLSLALFPAAFGLASVLMRDTGRGAALVGGAVSSIAAMALLVLALEGHSLVAFVLANLASGTGYALLVSGAFQMIDAAAGRENRAGLIAHGLLRAYLASGLLALAIGALADGFGLAAAGLLGVAVMLVLCLLCLLGLRAASPAGRPLP